MANYPQLDDQVGVWKLKEVNNAVSGGYWRNAGSRGLFSGGITPSSSNVIDFVTIATAGNAVDFGDLIVANKQQSTLSSLTRAIMGTGNDPSLTNTNIAYVTMATEGNAADFGDVTVGRTSMSGASNSTRGVFMGGLTPTRLNVIDYITIASTGNAIDFGNLTRAIGSAAGVASPTRALKGGGNTPYVAEIDKIEIATTGNAIDFGDLTSARADAGGLSSSTRGVFVGGDVNPGVTTGIEQVTIASAGNAIDYGDLRTARKYGGTSSNSVKGLYAGGGDGDSTLFNTIDQFEITTGGTSTDFGDLSVTRGNVQNGVLSQSHGGLNEGYQGTRPTHSAGAGRGLLGGGKTNPAGTNQIGIQSIQIQTLGNTNDFGDLTIASYGRSGCASRTRGVFGGGYKDASPADEINVIESIEFVSQGNAADFGDSTVARAFSGGNAGSQTRGIIGAGGNAPGLSDVIDYITIASAGNATDFGNLGAARSQFSGSGSPTRAIFYGGLE